MKPGLLTIFSVFRHKKWLRAGSLGLLCLGLLFMPAGLGSNTHVPIVSWGEGAVDSYCLEARGKSQNIYQVICALDSVLSVARSGEINAGIPGLGGSAAPAQALAPVHDTVKTLSDFLTFSIVLLMIEKQSMGMLSWLCLKLVFPVGVFCLFCAAILPQACPVLKKAGCFLCKDAVMVWLILPICAITSNFVDSRYITPKYNAQTARVKAEMAKVFQLSSPGAELSIGELASRAMSAWGQEKGKGLMGRLKDLYGYLKGSAVNPNDLAGLAMLAFSQIAVIVFVVPVLMLFVMLGLGRIILFPSA